MFRFWGIFSVFFHFQEADFIRKIYTSDFGDEFLGEGLDFDIIK